MFELMGLDRYPWSVWDDLRSLHDDFHRVLGDSGPRSGFGRFPLMNVWAKGDDVVVDVELPAVNPGEVDISVEGDELTVSGKRDTTPGGEDTVYRKRERPAGEFSRTVYLPYRVDAGAVSAKYGNGVLRITLPRAPEEKRRKIAIEA